MLKTDINPQKVILYGSYAYGNPDKDSDIDVAIFSNDFAKLNYFDSLDVVYKHLRSFKKINIEPVFFTYDEYIKGNDPFIDEIKMKGVVIV